MTFSKLSVDKRRRTYVRLIGEIQHALQTAFAEEAEGRNLTRTAMADALGVNKSFVTRKLNGTSNMTLETLADFAYALDRAIKISLVSRSPGAGANYGQSETMRFPTQSEASGANVAEWASIGYGSPGTLSHAGANASVV